MGALIHVKTTEKLKTVQKEQTELIQEIKNLQQRQEDFFQLQKQEERLYSGMVDTCAPEERIFFKDRGENSRFLARKAQTELKEQEGQLKKRKKDLEEQEQETERVLREEKKQREEED